MPDRSRLEEYTLEACRPARNGEQFLQRGISKMTIPNSTNGHQIGRVRRGGVPESLRILTRSRNRELKEATSL